MDQDRIIRAIRTEADYACALVRINQLMDAEFGSPAGAELDVLTDLVEVYEKRNVPMGYVEWESPSANSTEWAIACQFLVGITNRRRLAAAIKAYGDARMARMKD
jgi:hypothetical protein